MSKKTELKTLLTKFAYNTEQIISYLAEGNEHMAESYAIDTSSLEGQIEYLLGSRESEFDARVDLKTSPYGCSQAKMESYFENSDAISLQRCIGIDKLAALEVVDEMF